jgi:hypothetical protein
MLHIMCIKPKDLWVVMCLLLFFPTSSLTGHIPIYPQGAALWNLVNNGIAAAPWQLAAGGGGVLGNSGSFGTSWSGGGSGGVVRDHPEERGAIRMPGCIGGNAVTA